jgi:hypothetical protein
LPHCERRGRTRFFDDAFCVARSLSTGAAAALVCHARRVVSSTFAAFAEIADVG